MEWEETVETRGRPDPASSGDGPVIVKQTNLWVVVMTVTEESRGNVESLSSSVRGD